MPYTVEIDYSPAYELNTSLRAFTACLKQDRTRRHLELERECTEQVKRGLPPDFCRQVRAMEHPLAQLLIWQCPAKDDIQGFFEWADRLSPGDMFELVGPYLPSHVSLTPKDLEQQREEGLRILRLWYDHYFCRIDPEILEGLEKSAREVRRFAAASEPQNTVETATGGLVMEPCCGVETILLVPQYHYRPYNLTDVGRDLMLISYPVDALPASPGHPPPELERRFRALNDRTRLIILRLLANHPRTFTDLVQETGLAKSTIHYHMVLLRAAGLVRLHMKGKVPDVYALREEAFEDLTREVGSFLRL